MKTIDFRIFYDRFDTPVVDLDCGVKCAVHNPTGKPFCCDICQAVPAVYHQEWNYLSQATDLWHVWLGQECQENEAERATLIAETPENMLLLACNGPSLCQRPMRAVSCRQFPFFPYISSDLRFLGLAYEWNFEQSCWVISNLGLVTDRYRREFIQGFEDLFSVWPEEFNSYVQLSEELRQHFRALKRRFPLLHRNGNYYLVSPGSERRERISPMRLPRFGLYFIES